MKHFFLLVFLSLQVISSAQRPCSNPKKAKILTNSFQCHWKIVEIKDTISATIVHHERSFIPCAFKSSASVTIVKVKNRKIRILDVCNLKDFKVGQVVKIAPIEPPYSAISIPTYFEKTRKGRYIYRCNKYDESVKRTIWGQIIPKDLGRKKKSKQQKPINSH